MVKISTTFFILFFATAIAFIQGCGDEEDDVYPEISVSQPLSGENFENGDTISFQATFSDNAKLQSVEIVLVDKNNIAVLPNLSLVPDKNPFIVKGTYIISDPLLPGGVYQLRFRASDGTNVTNHFVDIQIYEMDRQLLYPLIVTHPENSRWTAYRLTVANTWKEIFSHTGDYLGSAVNSAASQFYTCGIAQSDLTAVKLPEGGFLWNVKPEIHQSLRWFEGITFNNNMLYISCAEGNIRGYDKTGNEIYKTETFKNAIPSLSVTTKNYVVAYFRDNFSNSNMLIAFHNEGGKMIHNKFILTGPIGLHHLNNDKVLVFSNSNEEGEISIYNGMDNTFGSLYKFLEGTFFETAALDSDNFIISGSSGLFWYRMSKNSLISIAPDLINCQIACDPVDQLIYASHNSMLNVLDFSTASVIQSYTLPGPVVDLHLVYNK
jgi:hypothetical protein